MPITKQQISDCLSAIVLSTSEDAPKQDIISAGLITSITVNNGEVRFILDGGTQPKEFIERLRLACQEQVKTIAGVTKVTGLATIENSNPQPSNTRKAAPTPKPLKGVKHIIAVGSGKGGVGKSTIASNLAVSLAQNGYNVGLLDSDIFGPSIGKMMGVEGKPELEGNIMIPPISYGVKCMSMSLLIDGNSPTVWRGSMVVKALYQLIGATKWQSDNGKELDYLIVDLPPGTGDIHLSLAQNFIIDGAIVVTTPQDVALIDVQKALGMFDKMHIKVIGLVENMSYFTDETGKKNYIFGQGKVDKLCKSLNIPKLIELPILPEISTSGDAGIPIVTKIDNQTNSLFNNLADYVTQTV